MSQSCGDVLRVSKRVPVSQALHDGVRRPCEMGRSRMVVLKTARQHVKVIRVWRWRRMEGCIQSRAIRPLHRVRMKRALRGF